MSDDLDYDGAFVMDELTDADAAPGSPNPQEYDEEFGPGIGRDIYALAAARGCEAVLPHDGQYLLLDLDDDAAIQLFELQLKRFNEFYAQFVGGLAEIYDEWTSRSGKGRHVILLMPWAMGNEDQRIMWQALFGSDIKRELYNQLRVLKEMPNPVTLFRPLPAGETEATVEVPRKDPIFDAPF